MSKPKTEYRLFSKVETITPRDYLELQLNVGKDIKLNYQLTPPTGYAVNDDGYPNGHKYPKKTTEKNGTNGLKSFMRLNVPEQVNGTLEMKRVLFDGSKKCLVGFYLQENIFISANISTMKKIN